MGKERKGLIITVLLFALYIFVFLLTELTVNERCGIVVGEENVMAVYASGIICTSVGYLFFHLSRRIFKSETTRKLIICIFAIGYLLLTLCFMFVTSSLLFVTSALISLLLFGYIGGFTHYTVSLFLFGKNYSGKVTSLAIAAATLLQFVMQNFLITDIALLTGIFLAVCGILCFVLRPPKDWMFENPLPYSKDPPIGANALIFPILIVAVMSVCFGLGDGMVTRLDAGGALNLTSYERLLYALGVLVAGVVADVGKRRFLPICTLCMLVIFSATASFIRDGNAATNGIYVCVMYLFSGFYVMYLTVTFMDAAPMTDKPDLWAGMGRIVRGVFIGLTVTFSNTFYDWLGQQGIVIVSIGLSLIVLVLFVVSGGFNLQAARIVPKKDKMSEFLSKYDLTPRETDVLVRLIENDSTNKDIAAELFISVRVVERYITSIYEKTGTHSRVKLIKLYYDE